MSCGEEFKPTGMAYEWVGSLFKSEDKKQVTRLESNPRSQQTKKPSVV